MAKIVIGKEAPIWIIKGGYIVQPPAGPPPGTNREDSSNKKAKGKIQKLRLFNRGSAMSGAPTCNGIIQFASPTNAGMMAPKIMISPCIVVIELKNAGSSSCSPGLKSSARISIAIPPAMNHIVHERTRYIVPMSLWFVAYNQRRQPCGWCVAATDVSVRASGVVVIAVNSSAWDSKAVNRVGRDSLRAK